MRNARQAYARTGCDWLLHVDADEFVWSAEPVAQVLGDIDPGTDCLALSVAERIHRAGDAPDSCLTGPFRRRFTGPRHEGCALFGPDYDLTQRGLTGHTQGKAFVRTGRGLRMSIHRPKQTDGADPVLARAAPDQLELLHFEGLTPQYWVYKLMRMAYRLIHHDGITPADHRRAQADALIADPDAATALYHRLKTFDVAQLDLLRAQDILLQVPFDPRNALAEYYAGQVVDLAPDTIDAWLYRNKAETLSFLRG